MLVAAIAFSLFLAGCMKNSGQFTISKQVGQAIQAGEILPDYRYYYAGRDTMPYAIIGIDKNYAVPSQYWIAFEPTSTKLKNMAGNIYGEMQWNPYGYHLMDTDGNIIGIWFSNIFNPSVRVDNVNRTVDIFFKNPESYNRL
jgi:hypothetical protein